MPYIARKEYEQVYEFLERQRAQAAAEAERDERMREIERTTLEKHIYALNKKIRACKSGPADDEWRRLMAMHSDLLGKYHNAGGTKL